MNHKWESRWLGEISTTNLNVRLIHERLTSCSSQSISQPRSVFLDLSGLAFPLNHSVNVKCLPCGRCCYKFFHPNLLYPLTYVTSVIHSTSPCSSPLIYKDTMTWKIMLFLTHTLPLTVHAMSSRVFSRLVMSDSVRSGIEIVPGRKNNPRRQMSALCHVYTRSTSQECLD